MDRGFPPDKLSAYFQADGANFKVRDSLRALATFKSINLLEPLSFPAKFDIVFCRNVAIYFSETDKARLYDSLAQVLAPDGYFIIGSTESLTGLSRRFEPKRHLRSVFYQLVAT
jgi:chemotaxis protein methyltransferase CheR